MSGSANANANGGASTVDDVELVTFRVGTQWFGVPVGQVQEVLLPQRLARVPLAPSDVVGFLNLRGQIVTAIDLAARLGVAGGSVAHRFGDVAHRPGDTDVVLGMDVVVTDGGELFALLVDDVGDVVTVAADAVAPAPVTLAPRWRELSAGVVRRERDVLIVLETGRLVGEPLVNQ